MSALMERWVVRVLVDRDPDRELAPTQWDWDVHGADAVVLGGECVGLVAPESSGEPAVSLRVDSGGKR